jgi:hypothetical protein
LPDWSTPSQNVEDAHETETSALLAPLGVGEDQPLPL